jgi:hypothetical protein
LFEDNEDDDFFCDCGAVQGCCKMCNICKKCDIVLHCLNKVREEYTLCAGCEIENGFRLRNLEMDAMATEEAEDGPNHITVEGYMFTDDIE